MSAGASAMTVYRRVIASIVTVCIICTNVAGMIDMPPSRVGEGFPVQNTMDIISQPLLIGPILNILDVDRPALIASLLETETHDSSHQTKRLSEWAVSRINGQGLDVKVANFTGGHHVDVVGRFEKDLRVLRTVFNTMAENGNGGLKAEIFLKPNKKNFEDILEEVFEDEDDSQDPLASIVDSRQTIDYTTRVDTIDTNLREKYSERRILIRYTGWIVSHKTGTKCYPIRAQTDELARLSFIALRALRICGAYTIATMLTCMTHLRVRVGLMAS